MVGLVHRNMIFAPKEVTLEVLNMFSFSNSIFFFWSAWPLSFPFLSQNREVSLKKGCKEKLLGWSAKKYTQKFERENDRLKTRPLFSWPF